MPPHILLMVYLHLGHAHWLFWKDTRSRILENFGSSFLKSRGHKILVFAVSIYFLFSFFLCILMCFPLFVSAPSFAADAIFYKVSSLPSYFYSAV